MKLSIIIVNHQSWKYLIRCLESIRTNNSALNVDHEIIVVNNGSDILKLDPDVKCIEVGENLGFGRANNLAAKKASGEILWFLNPDTEIGSENINLLLGLFSNDSKAGVIGPKLITEENKIQKWSAGAESTLADLIKNNLGFPASQKIWESKEKKECAWVSGAALFIKKDLFQKLGGFDEKFFMYFEDIDLCRRARQLGYKIVYYPEFVVRHLGGKSFGDKKAQKKLYYASQDHYFQKHFGKFTAFWVRLLRGIFK